MPGATTPITDREKAAIFAYKYGLIPDLKTAFIVAHDGPAKTAEGLKALNSAVSRWSNSEKFKHFAEYCTRVIADKESDAVKRGAEEEQRRSSRGETDGETATDNVSTKKQGQKGLDYYDPANQRRTINAIIEAARDDPKTQLDAIKAIQQTQRDDRQAAKDQQTQRLYSPLRCYDCPLHAKALKDSEKRTK